MRRYGFLTKTDTYEALNRLRDAFLAAKDGNEVNEIINGILKIQDLVGHESLRRRNSDEYSHLLGKYDIE